MMKVYRDQKAKAKASGPLGLPCSAVVEHLPIVCEAMHRQHRSVRFVSGVNGEPL